MLNINSLRFRLIYAQLHNYLIINTYIFDKFSLEEISKSYIVENQYSKTMDGAE